MSDVGKVSELRRLTLVATDEDGSFELEVVLWETAYDDEVSSGVATSASIYGYENRFCEVVGYGACTLQALRWCLSRYVESWLNLLIVGSISKSMICITSRQSKCYRLRARPVMRELLVRLGSAIQHRDAVVNRNFD